MSSAVLSTSAALGRPFLFDAESEPEVHCHPERSGKGAKRISRGVEEPALSLPKGSLPYSDPRLASVTPASRLEIRPAPEMVTSGIPALDALTGGLPRGCLTEICGPASSGRTTILLAALAAATRRGEYCAVIDASDALDPHSLAAAGIDLDHLLWIRCGEDIQQKAPKSTKESAGAPPLSRILRQGRGFDFPSQGRMGFQQRKAGSSPRCEGNSSLEKFTRNTRLPEYRLEQVLRATDLLLESGGFGLIILDLADLPPQSARRIPLTTWFRFRRAVEHKPTILLAIEQQPIAGSCSSLLLQLGMPSTSDAIRLKSQTMKWTKTMNYTQADSSREAAAWESPARQCRVSPEKGTQPRRDGTDFGGITADDALNIMHIAHPTHAHLLTELQIHAELIRSRLDRKPSRSVMFETKTAWAG
jgi:recombination protein RecA